MTSDDVRARLLDALRLDLVGPLPDDVAYAEEVLPTRLGERELTSPARAGSMARPHASVEWTADVLARRAERHALTSEPEQEELRQKVKKRTKDLLDTWERIAHATDGVLQYGKEVRQAPPLLYEPLDPELKLKPKEASHFKASRSLRDVEPTVNLWIRTPDNLELEESKS
jgi:hypothetical protein